ncbi:hypothetical protein [Bacillus sp. AFS053548]|uniref:hypothetical protein n=1 Tax=Bacillus sp. AFS053548 TaxID=2033505 RepID=UPI000BFBA4B6|nr:hypothetical protein [Bacillus sp. AFS053548]PGM58292.1 hypothetical protein CN946_05995 [Bacillus sp. AFS053548]
MKTSSLNGSIRLEGTLNPATNQMNYKIDQTAIGAKITLTSNEGKLINVPVTSPNGGIGVDGFKAESKP